jgi:hypothetical protein
VASDEPLSEFNRAYLCERVRNSFYDYVLRKFLEAEAAGLTKAELARRISKGQDRINKLLGSPGNWTIDTAAELLVGIAREELRPASEPILSRPRRNYTMADGLAEPDAEHQVASTPNTLRVRPMGVAPGGSARTERLDANV